MQPPSIARSSGAQRAKAPIGSRASSADTTVE
jgi:hypothetical protein